MKSLVLLLRYFFNVCRRPSNDSRVWVPPCGPDICWWIADLEAAGIKIIQVDEPALREFLPLRRADQAAYLDWSVNSFRLSTAGAVDGTQIHTHLCYSEFGVIIDAIDAIDGLDADVTSIEAARSRIDIVNDLEAHGFGRGVGPGVYDIRSPRVPGQAEVTELLGTAVKHVPARQLWVNPDCGLKTRGYAETEESLRNLVNATTKFALSSSSSHHCFFPSSRTKLLDQNTGNRWNRSNSYVLDGVWFESMF